MEGGSVAYLDSEQATGLLWALLIDVSDHCYVLYLQHHGGSKENLSW